MAIDEEVGDDVTRIESATGSSRPGNQNPWGVHRPAAGAAARHDLRAGGRPGHGLRAWTDRAAIGLTAARPDAIVAEMSLPGTYGTGTARIFTNRPSAAAEVLTDAATS
ncbi:hypothetical protein [Streptomyces sp. NPDC045251]|uniref:hypothetical protein n=1 Tax=unclassified Streptomyces TaxID=2593676 RepID=UPI0033F50B3D